MRVLVFLLRLVGFLLLFSGGYISRTISVSLQKTGREMDEVARKRALEERRQILFRQGKSGFLTGVERELYYTGLKVHFPKLTAELFVAGNLVVIAGLFVVICAFGGIGGGVCSILMWGVAEYLLLSRLKSRNLKSVSENLMKLLDFLGNYSVTSGEVAGILHQVSRYMENPLKAVLEACYYEAQTTGDAQGALLQMARKIEHPKFKELVGNMEVSLRYCADFAALVSGSRRSMLEYLRSAGERKGMLREALISMGLLLGMSFIILVAVGNLVQMTPMQLLTDTFPGKAGIVILVVIGLLFAEQLHRVHY